MHIGLKLLLIRSLEVLLERYMGEVVAYSITRGGVWKKCK